MRQVIGLAAIGAAKMLSASPLTIGNRFAALVAPPSRVRS
jgi:hypothetical protein